MKDGLNILIAGDFYVSDHFKERNLIDKTIQDLFKQSDYNIVNLEAPLTGNNPKNKIIKTGPHLCSSHKQVIKYLKYLQVDLVTLANNHILDYGEIGLIETFNALNKSDISYIGAGKDIKEANKVITIEKNDIKIAILNFTENEWSIAQINKMGANPLDIVENVKQIKAAKTEHDKVICIIHGGVEYYNLPSPRMRKQYRFYIENGADAIIGHHPHCIGGYEIYNDAPIIYSLGNFLFTLHSKNNKWYSGLLAILEIEKHKPISFNLYPVQQQKSTFELKLQHRNDSTSTLQFVKELNKTIIDTELFHKQWDNYLIEKKEQYLSSFLFTRKIKNRYIRAFFIKTGIDRKILNNNFLKLILNLIRCEAHYDVLKDVIDIELYKNIEQQ